MVEKSFLINFDVSAVYAGEILDFIHKYYLLPQHKFFNNIRRRRGYESSLSFTVYDPKKTWQIDVEMKSGKPLHLEMLASEATPESALKSVREMLDIAVQTYEENIHRSTLYFAWVEGQDVIPEEPPSMRKKASESMFSSSGMLLILLLFFGINIVLFIFFGFYAIILILAIQFAILLLTDKIFLRIGKWRITEENPYLHIVQYNIPVDEYERIQSKFGKDLIIKMKSEIYDNSLSKVKEPTCELAEEVFAKYGLECNPERKSAKVINVYQIVKQAVEKFNLPMPKIVISNTMLPNAAATGPSPSRGVVLITTGLLVHLEENEILSVVGHELGHLQGRDTLILFSIISGEFILRLTVLLPIVMLSPFLYILVAMSAIFFIAKFFEARADLLSAIKIGQPEVLAEGLRKIGYQRLQMERLQSSKIPTWIRWDTHPPIYFRIDRLEQFKTPVKVKNPLIQSAKDVINGFRTAFRI